MNHIHVKGEVSSLVVNKMADSVMTVKVASVSRGRFEHELA